MSRSCFAVRQPFKVVFGRRVREFREKRGWSQEQLAEQAGLTRETISRIETAKFGTKFEYVDKIVGAFDVSFSEFFKDLPDS
jgi:transcriptional regulator with XRE-family HTH domain